MRAARVVCRVLVTAGLVALGACDLNPQPLPPGDTPESGAFAGTPSAGEAPDGGNARRNDGGALDAALDAEPSGGDAMDGSLSNEESTDALLEGSSNCGEADAGCEERE